MNNSFIPSKDDYHLDSREAKIHVILIIQFIIMNIVVTVKLYLEHRHHLEPIHVFELSYLIDLILSLITGNFTIIIIISRRLSISNANFCFWTNMIFYIVW